MTNIIVESGQTVVLGGLFVEDTTVGRSQVPILGDIPLIGAAFKGQDDDFRRSEVIFMVKTTIMDHADLALIGDKAGDRVNDARIAIRNGLLPFSNDKLVSAHLLDARRHYEAGREGKAMWSVNLALHLSPTSEDAIALKELIAGESFEYADQTFFGRLSDDMIDGEIEVMPTPEEAPSVDQDVILFEQSLSEADSPSQDQAAAESRFVAPVAGLQSQPDNAAAAETSGNTVILVDEVEELTVIPADASAGTDAQPALESTLDPAVESLFDPEMVVEVDTMFDTTGQ